MSEALAARFLALHLSFHPVDAGFMGVVGFDHALPPADPEAAERERAGLAALMGDPAWGGASMTARLVRNVVGHALRNLADRPRFADPTWYAGEVAFGVIGLLLPRAVPAEREALAGRLAAVPRFLGEGAAQLLGVGVHGGIVARARRELAAITGLLTVGLRRHPLWGAGLEGVVEAAVRAIAGFDAVVAGLAGGDPRCGAAHLDFVMREVHALPFGAEEAVALAEAAIGRARAELVGMAGAGWQGRLREINAVMPEGEIGAAYRYWHERALTGAAGLVTPADDYGLDFVPFPAWAEGLPGVLYFLAYRCPPAGAPGGGSVYWTPPGGQSVAAIKGVHAVHHGSIGHHTQNARARVAGSSLARVLGQDMARGIMAQAAGTMCEGWSCYMQELMTEVEGFYDADDLLVLKAAELRNAACLVADIRFHSGAWDMGEMQRYLRDIALVPAERVEYEAVKNALYPGNRLMYWAGVALIREARQRWRGDMRDFHDGLIAAGHVPVAWAIAAMEAA